MASHGRSSYGRPSYGRRRMTPEEEAKFRELQKLREEYIKRMKEEEEEKRKKEALESNVVGVQDVEMYAWTNSERHETKYFDVLLYPNPPVILRRGIPFNMIIRFQRQYDFSKDVVTLQFTIGTRPRASKGTLVELPITNKESFTMPSKEWDIRLNHEEPKIMHLEVQISCKAAVGVWNLKIISKNPNFPISREYSVEKTIYVLFNPWCKDDSVFMEDRRLRDEYVLNEVGKLFNGTSVKPSSRRWVFGQFSTAALPAAMAILENSSLDDVGRGSPVKVVRALSAMLNVENDEGVLEGRWKEPYDDGVPPYAWTGSVDILQRYLKNGYQPVKYAQCWVYAGLFTTVCRALGIPCRPVTNFVSAHDTDDTLTIDRYFTAEGHKLDNDDSIWNFHVWNDCWMTRPDLPPGYGGWQAVDSTPQETSEGIFQTGPASVNAIKRGEIGYMYDSPFVFSEVNADVIHWQRDLSQRLGWRKIQTNRYEVGKLVATKRPGRIDYDGDSDLENITYQYKSLEGTPEERLAIRNAATHGNYATIFEIPPAEAEDVFFDMLEIDKVMIGQPFSVVVNIENKSNEERNVIVALTAESVFYTGIKASTIKHNVSQFVLKPHQKEVLSMKITAEEYYDRLVDYSMMKIFSLATVEETKQTWTEEDDFMVEKPRLKLDVSRPLQVGKPFELSISLKNPLKLYLKECSFVVEGPGVAEPQRSGYRDIKPEEEITHKLSFVPKREGRRDIIVIFNSKQLIDVQGSMEVEVN